MKSIRSRLLELAESVSYRKDFNDLKKSILRLKTSIHKEKFAKIDPIKSIEAKIIHWTLISLKEVQSLLKDGNINEHCVEIPSIKEYEDFKTKYDLNFFFDPARSYSKMILSPFVSPILWSFSPDVGTKITMTVDISYPMRILKAKFDAQIKLLKKMWKLKEERKERYSDDDIYRVRKLRKEGLTQMQILRELYPAFKNCNLSYGAPKGSTSEQFNAYNAYHRIGRLIKKGKTQKL